MQGNSIRFYEQLEQLNEFIKKKWLAQGKPESEFQELEPKILIVLDNARYHKEKTTLLEIEEKLQKIQLSLVRNLWRN